MKGNAVHGAWDTYRDARQYGGIVFGMEAFMVQVVDSRFLAAYGKRFGPHPTAGEEAA